MMLSDVDVAVQSNKFEEANGNGSNDAKPYQFVG